MAPKGAKRAAPSATSRPPLHFLLLFAPPALEAWFALRRHWFTEEALYAHIAFVNWTYWGSLALAGLLCLWPRARAAAAERLEVPARAWLSAAFLAVFALHLFLKWCQYRGFQLPLDSAATANVCYNIAHRLSFACPILGVGNHFAVHFIPLLALLAPLLLFWNGLWPLILLQAALTASMPVAAYLLAERKTGSALAGCAAFWLVYTSPFLLYLASASVYPGMYLSFFFVWAAVFWTLDRPLLAGAALVLMLLSIEQACFALFGLGLYLALSRGLRDKRRLITAGATCLGAALLLDLELKLKYSFPESANFRTWSMYSHLGPNPLAAASAAFAHPLATAQLVAWPPEKLSPLGAMLASTGFLPLLSPLALVPWAVNYLPNFLANPGDYYHDIILQYAGYTIGPLWWAAALGLAKAYSWLKVRGQSPWLVAGALLAGAWNINAAPNILVPDWRRAYFNEVPVLAAAIPPTASVWAMEYATPWLAGRSSLKSMPRGLDAAFLGELFAPDYVLIERSWAAAAAPEVAGRVLTFLSREGYVKAAERSALVLLRRPGPPPSAPRLELPATNPAAARAYQESIRRNDDWPATAGLFRVAAERGDARAQDELALCYFRGLGVPKDLEQSLRWWSAAAASGDPDAANNVGVILGDKGRYAEALDWFQRAAAAGNADAEDNLGLYSLAGRGMAADREKALLWFRRAAGHGNQRSKDRIALLERRGDRQGEAP